MLLDVITGRPGRRIIFADSSLLLHPLPHATTSRRGLFSGKGRGQGAIPQLDETLDFGRSQYIGGHDVALTAQITLLPEEQAAVDVDRLAGDVVAFGPARKRTIAAPLGPPS